MGKAFGINELLNKSFKHRSMDEKWVKHIGNLETKSIIIIKGDPKNGKTDYCLKLVKEQALNGATVFYSSQEQGKSESLKLAVGRNNMQDVVGKVMFGSREPFEDLLSRMKKPRAGNTLVIDSWDYLNLTVAQFKKLQAELKNKTIIIICWLSNKKAKAIEHMADVIVTVSKFKAYPESRYGGNEVMNFFEGQRAGQGELFS